MEEGGWSCGAVNPGSQPGGRGRDYIHRMLLGRLAAVVTRHELDLGYLGEMSTEPLALLGVGTQTPQPLPQSAIDKPHLSLTSIF